MQLRTGGCGDAGVLFPGIVIGIVLIIGIAPYRAGIIADQGHQRDIAEKGRSVVLQVPETPSLNPSVAVSDAILPGELAKCHMQNYYNVRFSYRNENLYGENKMAERTKIRIANTMKRLLQKKPIEDIRATEICREAEMFIAKK